MKISAVIIVKNAQKTIGATLESLKNFDEVVVYDNGSTDTTIAIVNNFENTKLFKGDFIGFGPTKNLAANYAKNDWIFSIDSDEIVSPQLLSILEKENLDNDTVYSIERFNYYRKQRVRFSGWGKEIIYRLYNRNSVKFNNKMLHESIDVSTAKKRSHLKGELRHYSFHNVSDFIQRTDLYSTLYAEENMGKKKSSVLKAVSSGFNEFFKKYILHFGFLDGYRGWLIAVSGASGSFYKYLKLYEANLHNNLKCSLIITTYNRPDALLRVLESILHQEIPPDEIIIADDGSGEETRETIKEFARHSFIPVKHSWQEDKGFRPARARNSAIAMSDYDYIIAIDGDMVLHKSFVKDHLSCAKRGNYIQGSRVFLNEKLTEQLLKVKNKKIQNIIFSTKIKNRLNGLYIPIASRLYCIRKSTGHKGIRSCNFSLFKSDILKVNGFNEDFITWGKEDSEFVERLFNIGIKRRNLKFKAIQYHLYHKENNVTSNNIALLQKAIKQNLKYCENGINQHYRE